ncbi:suppressor of fused domain protein [Clostridium sp. DJ247]|uniref:suppressor of fused domain protein n=1 Tax=Clostridium sp. DJ247 TaxID=2726188 RepID=UPI00162A4546|nr:suppressor of fused domain protein [Clostridium sp. DJ247]MBC2582745.1 hypothetical protein [Clostridium sp. DJ247]
MDSIQITKEIRSAIKQGNVERVVELIDSSIEYLNMMTPFGTWLHVAASQGKLEIVQRLIDLGADINRRGGVYGGSAVNEAASEGHIKIVKYLLSCGAEMDVSEPERNPLFGAIANGHADIAKLLIDNGIDIHVKYNGESMKNMDALAFAREQGQIEIVKLLENITENITTEENRCEEQKQHEDILEHITKYFGPVSNTINEIIPGSRVAVNIHIIQPSKERNFITLVTTGMSDYPMDSSKEAGEFKYAELLLKLPANWSINKNDMRDQKNYWPLGWLRKTAHIPHIYDGWLSEEVILPNGEPPKPFAINTKLSCIMISKPKESGFERLVTSQGNIINFYTLIPIYEEERNFALEKGCEHLIKKMNERGITDVLDITRENIGL